MRVPSLRGLVVLVGATAVALVLAGNTNAADDRALSASSAGASRATAAVGPTVGTARVAARGASRAVQDGTLLASHHGRVRGHVSIGHGHHSYFRPYVSFGWPYYGYYGLYGHYAGWPYYGSHWPYPAETYGIYSSDRPGAVETDVRPGRAELSVDGEVAGQARDFNGTWDILWLTPGSHRLEFSREGYQTLQIRVDVDPGSYYRIRQRLTKGEGIDPRSKDLLLAPESVPTDTPTERAEPRYRVPQETPAPGDRGPGLARGFLTIEATPLDAAVYLDGKFLANAGELARLHGALAVAEGEHSVEVVRPGYRSVTQRITVNADETATVTVRLQRDGGST